MTTGNTSNVYGEYEVAVKFVHVSAGFDSKGVARDIVALDDSGHVWRLNDGYWMKYNSPKEKRYYDHI